MQTNFTDVQLADTNFVDAKKILTTCVHYGFCTSGCPTYVLTRDENDAPRGRIDLIKEMLEKGGAPSPKTVYHLDRCLSCLSCMTTCAVNVDYLHLSDIGRAYIEENYRRPFFDRLLRNVIAWVIPNPRVFRRALVLGRAFKSVGKLLGGRIRALSELVPGKVHGELLPPSLYPAEGQPAYRVILLAGCAQQVLNGAINRSTIRILNRHGCDVIIPQDAACCGAITQHMGKMEVAKRAMRRNIDAWRDEIAKAPIDGIIVNASGCGTTVKDYGKLFEHDPEYASQAEEISSLAMDVTEFLSKIGINKPSNPRSYRVAYHDACSLQHAQKVREQPRKLLRDSGYQVVDVPEAHFCCGSAGTFNMLQPALAQDLGRRKSANIEATEPEIVSAGNIGCMTQLELYSETPIVHTVELLDWATGGPKPQKLVDRNLGEPAPQRDEYQFGISGTSVSNTNSKNEDVGFW